MKKLSVRKRCAIIIGAVLLAIYLIVSVIFWFTGMPKIFFRYKVKEDNTISIDYYSGFFPLLRIPDKIDGLPVTELDWRLNEYSIYSREEYKYRKNYLAAFTVAVHIPDSVEILRTNVFNGFSCLTFVNIPSTLRSTENDLFVNTNVYKLVFPEGITEIGVSHEEESWRGSCSFGYMKHLRKVVFPESLKKIGNNAFAECPQLRKVTLPEGLEEIEAAAFRESGLSKINIPKNLKKIGGIAFIKTPFEKKLEKKTDGDFIIFNGDIIYKYIGKDENVIIPDNITSICGRAFWDRTVKSVTIPEGVRNVGGAFEYSEVEKIELPDTVEGDDLEFYNCKYLKEIRLPENTTKLCSSAFKNCYSLENIVLPEGITEIGNYAFSQCASLSEIKLPEGLTKIGNNAFEYCQSLKDIEIPEGVTEIARDTFSFSGIENIRLPDSIVKISDEAFENTPYGSKLSSDGSVYVTINGRILYNCQEERVHVEIPDGIVSVRDNAINKWVESVVIPEGVQYMGSALIEKPDLRSIELPDSIASDDELCFSGCSSLMEIRLPKNITAISDYAFYQCSSLKKIVVPENVISIGKYSFQECESLTDVELPDGLERIGERAFAFCNSLERIVIPESVTYIDSDAFMDCRNLKEVVIKGDPIIEKNSFTGCKKLKNKP